MTSPDESFTYQHKSKWGDIRGNPVTVRPMNENYIAWRLRLTTEEAIVLQKQRVLNQHNLLPKFVGEYVIDGLGYGRSGLQETHIGAVVAHRESLGLSEQIYGGYRGVNFLRTGLLFGDHSDDGAAQISDNNAFCAAQVQNWSDQAGYAKNNPFDHMTRGDTPELRAPILASFEIDMLDTASEREKTITPDTYYWTPKNHLRIEDTVQIVYHRGRI